jgi:hypothetical protein
MSFVRHGQLDFAKYLDVADTTLPAEDTAAAAYWHCNDDRNIRMMVLFLTVAETDRFPVRAELHVRCEIYASSTLNVLSLKHRQQTFLHGDSERNAFAAHIEWMEDRCNNPTDGSKLVNGYSINHRHVKQCTA